MHQNASKCIECIKVHKSASKCINLSGTSKRSNSSIQHSCAERLNARPSLRSNRKCPTPGVRTQTVTSLGLGLVVNPSKPECIDLHRNASKCIKVHQNAAKRIKCVRRRTWPSALDRFGFRNRSDLGQTRSRIGTRCLGPGGFGNESISNLTGTRKTRVHRNASKCIEMHRDASKCIKVHKVRDTSDFASTRRQVRFPKSIGPRPNSISISHSMPGWIWKRVSDHLEFGRDRENPSASKCIKMH